MVEWLSERYEMNGPFFEENQVLFGSDPTEGIVAVEPSGDNAMRIFIRSGDRLGIRDR